MKSIILSAVFIIASGMFLGAVAQENPNHKSKHVKEAHVEKSGSKMNKDSDKQKENKKEGELTSAHKGHKDKNAMKH